MRGRLIAVAVLLLLKFDIAAAATWGTWNGKTVGSSTGNVSSFNGKTIGTTSGNIGGFNGLVSPGGGGGGGSAPLFVSAASSEDGGATTSTSTISVATSGNTLAGGLWWSPATRTLNSITATCASGNFTLANNPTADTDNAGRFAGFAKVTNASGSCTLTATFSGTVTGAYWIYAQVSGTNATPIDVSAAKMNDSGTTPQGDAPTSGSLTTTSANDYLLCIGFDVNVNSDLVTGSGFTTRLDGTMETTSQRGSIIDKTVASAGATSCNWTTSSIFNVTDVIAIAIKP